METRNIIFILQIVIFYCNAQQFKAESSPFLAGKNTPVWFLESNPKDNENSILNKIPDAIEKAGLIDINSGEGSLDKSNQKRNKNPLYIEILVVVDYALYKKIGENIKDALKYIISFWISVDLRYRPLTSPKVYISIAGIVIAKDPKALNYIEKNKDHLGKVNGNNVLFEAGKYFKNKNETANHDILVTLTGEDICTIEKDNDVCDSYTVGVSLIGKACHSNLSTTFVEDNGAFSGVLTATHEIGHLLRIPHDGTGSAAYCFTHESYIMATSVYENNSNNYKWSHCSKEVFQELPSKPLSECLKNKPNPGSPVKFLLPGQVLSADQQCERIGHGPTCSNPVFRACNSLLCNNKEDGRCKKSKSLWKKYALPCWRMCSRGIKIRKVLHIITQKEISIVEYIN